MLNFKLSFVWLELVKNLYAVFLKSLVSICFFVFELNFYDHLKKEFIQGLP